jgi:uncharacterized protein (TIGR04141 family)
VPDPTKTRSLSIFLLKEGIGHANALVEDHRLGEPVIGATIPNGSVLYVFDGPRREPWWKMYFGITQELLQSSKSALMFLPASGRTLAVCFGHVAHNLRDDSYEYDFGLKITLNCVDPKKLKNTDVIEPGAARRQRTQVSVDSDLTFFDFESDSTVLRSLTGAVKSEYSDLIRNVTGSSNVRISSKVRVGDLGKLGERLLELYDRDDYKTSFPEVQNVTPVRDPQQIRQLDESLLVALRAQSTDVLLAVPEMVEYNDSFWISFAGAGKSELHHEVYQELYYDYLSSNGFAFRDLDRDGLSKHKLTLLNDDNTLKTAFSMYKCLIFDTRLTNEAAVFHLMEGNWFRFEDDYIKRISAALEPFVETAVLPDCAVYLEGDYNIAATSALGAAVCLDKTNMSPRGQTQVEPCDVLAEIDETAVFVHVKFSTSSSQLSHLFNQGSNSMQLLKSVDDAARRLEGVIVEKAASPALAARFNHLIAQGKYRVQYGIVTHKDPSNGVENLPLFSRLSLARATRSFRAMSVPVSVSFIPNKAPSRPGKPKARKKRTTSKAK